MNSKEFYLYLAGIILAAVFFALDLSLELGVAGGIPYIALVLLGLWSRQKRYLLVASLTGTTLILLGYFLSPPGGELWKVFLNRFLALSALWVTAILCLFYKRKEEALWRAHQELQSRVESQTADLKTANEDLLAKISEHKKAQESLLESKMRIRAIMDNTVDAIITIDQKGILKTFNPAAEKIFGVSASEAIGQNISRLMPNPYREEHDEYIQRYLHTGEARIIGFGREVPGLRKDGITVPLELAVSEMFVDGQQWFIGILRDITERKLAEQELKDSRQELRDLFHRLQTVREKERTRIAREIHDELGQMLTALKMDVSWLGNKLPKECVKLSDKTCSMLDYLDTTILNVQRIARDLRPEILDLLGLSEAIEWQAQEFQKRTGIQCNLNLFMKDIGLDQDCSTTIFRILQETLTNVARYADASEVNINLNNVNGYLVLEVKDNGKGISENQITSSKSLGLIGIRERVFLLDGNVEIQGAQGKGTSVTISIPFKRLGNVSTGSARPGGGTGSHEPGRKEPD